MEPVIVTQKANCRNCYKCIRSCPQGAIAFSDDQARVLSQEEVYARLTEEEEEETHHGR